MRQYFSLRTSLAEIGGRVMEQGRLTSPRGMRTRELIGETLMFQEPTDSLPVGIGRKLNPAIGAVEALQLIAGTTHPELMLKIQPRFAQFMDDDAFWGAYGPRTWWQLQFAQDKLLDDPDTRQAVVTIWDPTRDNITGKSDYPCTVTQQFLIREKKLIMHTTMRSNDVWWGLSYDAFQFSQLQLTMARAVAYPCGPYYHHAVSLHVYERDFDNMSSLTTGDITAAQHVPNGVGSISGEPWRYYAKRARKLLFDEPLQYETESEKWYRNALAKYR